MEHIELVKLGMAIETKEKTCEELLQDTDLNSKLDQLSEDDLDTLWEMAVNATSEHGCCPTPIVDTPFILMEAASFLGIKLRERENN